MRLNLELSPQLAITFGKNRIDKIDVLLFFSMIAIGSIGLCIITLNSWFWHYPGNNYFPDNTLCAFLVLLLTWLGCSLVFSNRASITYSIQETLIFFIVLCCIAWMTNAVQFTPFIPIDDKIIHLEKTLHIHLLSIISWTNQFPTLINVLQIAYSSLGYQMAFLPLYCITQKQYHRLHRYYCLLLLTTLLGFTSYYFFPTTAPASHLHSALFTVDQHATGLKFYQIHHGIRPSTIDGGLIALPSYHTIWALLLLYLGFPHKRLFFLGLLPLNILLIAACFCLGWHYVLDILAGGLVVCASGLAIRFYVRK